MSVLEGHVVALLVPVAACEGGAATVEELLAPGEREAEGDALSERDTMLVREADGELERLRDAGAVRVPSAVTTDVRE